MTDGDGQISRAELRTMSADAVLQAQKDGRFSDLLAGRAGKEPPRPGIDERRRGDCMVVRRHLQSLPPGRIVEMRKTGELDELLAHGLPVVEGE